MSKPIPADQPGLELPPAYFVVQGGSNAGQLHLLGEPLFTIGRVADNDLAIGDTRVSRRHAHVRREDYRYYLEDLGSTNGTWLNGARLSEPAQLRNGDQVQIAGVLLVFHDPSTTTQAEAFQVLALDESRGRVLVAGQAIKLTAKELALLRLLIEHAGELCDKDMIAQAVWPEYDGDVADYNIEGLVSRLRHKIEPDTDHPVYLQAHRGVASLMALSHAPAARLFAGPIPPAPESELITNNALVIGFPRRLS